MSEEMTPAEASADGAGDCSAGPGLVVSITVTVLLFNLIAGLAGSVDIISLRAQLHRKLGIGCGLLCQFVLMPFIGFLVITLMSPEPHVGLVLMILCSSSGGAYSNWWCSLFNLDLALSVAMTAVSTLLSAVLMPVNLTLYLGLVSRGVDVEVPWADICRSLGVVLAAIITGVSVSTYIPGLKPYMNRIGNISGVLMIGTSFIASSMKKKPASGAEEVTPLWGHEASFYLVIAMPFMVSVLASLAISSMHCLHLKRPERVAIVVEVSYQNVGISSAVALAAFCGNPRKLADAAAVPVIYGMIEAVCLAIFCLTMWKLGWTYSPAEERLCTVITSDYQPHVDTIRRTTSTTDVLGKDLAERKSACEKTVSEDPASTQAPCSRSISWDTDFDDAAVPGRLHPQSAGPCTERTQTDVAVMGKTMTLP